MDNLNLRNFLFKNRCLVDVHKLDHRKLTYADTWLAFKFIEYNLVLDEIRDQYKETSKSINRMQRDTADQKDEFLEETISPQIYQIMFGRCQQKDSVLESIDYANVAEMMKPDEDSIHRSLHWNQVALNRIRDIQTWEKIQRCLMVSFCPEPGSFESKIS